MSWRNLIWLSIILVLAGLSIYLARNRGPRVAPQDPVVRQLSGLIHSYEVLNKKGYRDLPPELAVRGGIEGMVRQIDEFCVYLPPDKADQVRRRVAGIWDETGLRIICRDGKLVTLGALPGSPAHKARLAAGAEVLAINDTDAAYLTLAQARALLENPKLPAVVKLAGPDGDPVTVTLEPAEFVGQSVTGLVRDEQGNWSCLLDERAGLYYIRINEFIPQTPEQFQVLYAGCPNLRGLVLDLRHNPGGELNPALAVADAFLDSGLIVRTIDRAGREINYRAHAAGDLPDAPLVILVDEGTASAAEIVAGSLQARGRATLVGQQTFGKWCVQTPVDLEYGLGVVYLTTAYYYLPSPLPTTVPTSRMAVSGSASTQPGRQPGLVPDVAVRQPARNAELLDSLRQEIAVLPGTPAATQPGRPSRAAAMRDTILARDAQLTQAIDVLRRQLPATKPASTRPAAIGSSAP